MTHSEELVVRIRTYMQSFEEGVTEKDMLGGHAFLWRGNLVCGVKAKDFFVRVPEPNCSELIAKDPQVQQMQHEGKDIEECVHIAGEKMTDDELLSIFIMVGVVYANDEATKK